MFNMLELNKRIVQGVVDIVESDDESEASVKMKRLAKLLKSKAYKEKQDKMQEIITQSKRAAQSNIESDSSELSDDLDESSLDEEAKEQWQSLCEEVLEFRNYKQSTRKKRGRK